MSSAQPGSQSEDVEQPALEPNTAQTTAAAESQPGAASTSGPPPRIVIEQPDGGIAIGADPERIPKPPLPRVAAPAAGAHDSDSGTPTEAVLAAISAAGFASFALGTGEQRAAAQRRISQVLQEQKATVTLRKFLFLAMLLADFSFFIAVLIYQVLRQPHSDAHPQGRGSVPVTLWISMGAIKLEDIIFSLVLAVFGFFGAIQNRVGVLSLFILLEALCTALITLSGLSLFHLTRVLLIFLAFYLRSALFTANALGAAAAALQGQPFGVQHRPLSWATLAAPFVGMRRMLDGSAAEHAALQQERQRRQREQQQQESMRQQRRLMQVQALAQMGLGPDGLPLQHHQHRQPTGTNSQAGSAPHAAAAAHGAALVLPGAQSVGQGVYVVRLSAQDVASAQARHGGGPSQAVVLQLVDRQG